MFVGVDVGGTNTDAVLMDGQRLRGAVKVPTTEDVTAGIVSAVSELLKQDSSRPKIEAVMVGTTHFTNALLEKRGLSQTAVIRLSMPATQLLPPLVDCPDEFREAIGNHIYMVRGGNEFDGREISPLDWAGIRDAAKEIRGRGVRAIAVCGVFSPVDPAHELEAARLIKDVAPDVRVCMSHENGRMGLLERENAAVLNACLGETAATTIQGIESALELLGHSRSAVHEPERWDADGHFVCVTVSGADNLVGSDEQHARRGVLVGHYRRDCG